MKPYSFLLSFLSACILLLGANDAGARSRSIVTFEAKMGIVFVDSKKSLAAYRLFESLNVPVTTEFMRQVKIFAPEDGTFRIACEAVSTDYACAVIVYAGEHATLDFKTDHVELHLPAKLSKLYAGIFPKKDDGFHFTTEDKKLSIDWTPSGLHIESHERGKGRDI